LVSLHLAAQQGAGGGDREEAIRLGQGRLALPPLGGIVGEHRQPAAVAQGEAHLGDHPRLAEEQAPPLAGEDRRLGGIEDEEGKDLHLHTGRSTRHLRYRVSGTGRRIGWSRPAPRCSITCTSRRASRAASATTPSKVSALTWYEQ